MIEGVMHSIKGNKEVEEALQCDALLDLKASEIIIHLKNKLKTVS